MQKRAEEEKSDGKRKVRKGRAGGDAEVGEEAGGEERRRGRDDGVFTSRSLSSSSSRSWSALSRATSRSSRSCCRSLRRLATCANGRRGVKEARDGGSSGPGRGGERGSWAHFSSELLLLSVAGVRSLCSFGASEGRDALQPDVFVLQIGGLRRSRTFPMAEPQRVEGGEKGGRERERGSTQERERERERRERERERHRQTDRERGREREGEGGRERERERERERREREREREKRERERERERDTHTETKRDR